MRMNPLVTSPLSIPRLSASPMKLVTHLVDGRPRHGVIIPSARGPEVLDVLRALVVLDRADTHTSLTVEAAAARYGADLLGLIERQDEAMPRLREAIRRAESGDLGLHLDGQPLRFPLAGATLLSPIPRPPSMRDGYAFRQHVETARRNRGLDMIPEFDQFPVFYFTNHQAVTGPGEVRVMPRHLDRLDFELEAAIVVGRRGRNLSVGNADEAIFGLTVMNDWSARALQMDEMKLSLGPAKGKDFATSLGPVLVTLDELEEKATRSARGRQWDLKMTAKVNGEQVSEGNLRDMTWTFAEILERASYGVDLHPGDVIGSGTCGTGCFLELNGTHKTNRWLQVGDTVALEVERLGALENVIVAERT
jgi:fumarylacetoacetate (FAA) hydrolase